MACGTVLVATNLLEPYLPPSQARNTVSIFLRNSNKAKNENGIKLKAKWRLRRRQEPYHYMYQYKADKLSKHTNHIHK